MGKHISEFMCSEDNVPELFILLFDCFMERPGFLETEGIFRLACDDEEEKKLEQGLMEGRYEVLTSVQDPHIVASFIKRLLREMGEPLCTFELYPMFRDTFGRLKAN